MTLCPKDATSNKYYFTSAAEWAAFSGGITTAVLRHLYGLQDASSPSVDSINAANLANGMNFQVAVTGWTLKGTGSFDTGGLQAFNNVHASLVDLNTTSQTSISLLTITNTPAAQRSVLLHGPGGTETNNIVLEYNTANHYVITDGTNSGTGATNHGTGVVPVTLRHDVTHSTQAVFIDYTSPEKITKTFVLPASGGASKGVWLGDAYAATPTLTILMHAVLTGSNAELTDAQVTALHARFNTGTVTSIALSPSSPSLIVGNTQQLTATATFQDTSTSDISSNTNNVYTSLNPAVASVSTTGLITAVGVGTTTITCAYAAVTSSTCTVTVGSGVSVPLPVVGVDVPDHQALALARLPEQDKNKPNIAALVNVCVSPAVALESALWQLLTQRQVTTALGSQLDALGKLVGQARNGLSDADYATYIAARISANRSSGLIEDLLRVAKLLINNTSAKITYSYGGPGTAIITISGITRTTAQGAALASFMQSAIAAGIRVVVEYSTNAIGSTFRYDVGPGYDVGHYADGIG